MHFILDYIEFITGKNGLEIAISVECTKQNYHQYKKNKNISMNFLKRIARVNDIKLKHIKLWLKAYEDIKK